MYDLEAIYNDSFTDELMKIAEEGEKKQSKGTALLAGSGVIGGLTGVNSYLDYNKNGNLSNRKLVKALKNLPRGQRTQAAKVIKGLTHTRNAGGALLAGGLLAGGLSKRKKYMDKEAGLSSALNAAVKGAVKTGKTGVRAGAGTIGSGIRNSGMLARDIASGNGINGTIRAIADQGYNTSRNAGKVTREIGKTGRSAINELFRK